MRFLTILSVVFPVLAGVVLFIWRPQDRAIRNRYSIWTVCVSSAFVLGTALCCALHGPDATAFYVARFSKHLEFAFRPDGVSLVFGCIIGVLWPVTTVYAFSYMEHESKAEASSG